jgi:hypothetical protein
LHNKHDEDEAFILFLENEHQERSE